MQLNIVNSIICVTVSFVCRIVVVVHHPLYCWRVQIVLNYQTFLNPNVNLPSSLFHIRYNVETRNSCFNLDILQSRWAGKIILNLQISSCLNFDFDMDYWITYLITLSDSMASHVLCVLQSGSLVNVEWHFVQTNYECIVSKQKRPLWKPDYSI